MQVGLEDVVATVLGRGHYERADGTMHRLPERLWPSHPEDRSRRAPPPAAEGAGHGRAGGGDIARRAAAMTPELGALIRRGYVRGLSTRDVAGLYAEVFGGRVSKSAASRATQVLQAEFDAWRTRD